MRRSRLLLLASSLVATTVALTGCVSLPGGGESPDAVAEYPQNMGVGGVTFTQDGVLLTEADPRIDAPAETDVPDVSVVFDPMCPHCAVFEQEIGPALTDLVADGEITLTMYPLSFVAPRASPASVNAIMAVTSYNPDVAKEFIDELLAANYETGGAGLDDDALVELADQVGAGSTEVTDAIRSGTFLGFANTLNETLLGNDFPGASVEVSGTPLVIVDGEAVGVDRLSADPAQTLAALQGSQ